MKLKDIGIIFRWRDTTGEVAMSRFRYYGVVDRRRIRRSVRKHFKPMGITIGKRVIDFHIANRSYELYGEASGEATANA